MEIIPWPVAYGIGGGSLVVLFSFVMWFIRQLAKGYDAEGKKHGLVPGSAVAVLIGAERKRGDDFEALYKAANLRATVLEEQIGRTVVKILDALPVPDSGRADR